MDYIFQAAQRLGAPPMFRKDVMDLLADRPPIPAGVIPAEATFTRAKKNKLPQAIAHRGSKVNFPENTMRAFRAAVEEGVDALETDLHISKDGVLVVSHDPTLLRCYGVDKKVSECDWKELSELRTLREPRQPMPRFDELLKYFARPETAGLWILLDIKLSNDPDTVMRLIAENLSNNPSAPGTKWQDRIILGCWAARYIPSALHHLPSYPITNINFSIPYTRQFLALPNITFNTLFASLVSPSGQKFLTDAQAASRPVYAWTVNDEKAMDWCIRRRVDGVITDDPAKFIKFRDGWTREREVKWSVRVLLGYVKMNAFMVLFAWLFWLRHGWGLVMEVGKER